MPRNGVAAAGGSVHQQQGCEDGGVSITIAKLTKSRGRSLAAALVLAAAGLIAGCTSISYDLGNLAPTAQAPRASAGAAASGFKVAVTHPRYGDRKPHPWSGRAPHAYAVHGTDASKYQRSVDWAAARDSGISFAFLKATEGGDMADEYFAEHWRGTREAGIPRSAYHFYYFCRSAREQAEWFIKNVPRDSSALPHVLDMEWNHLSPSCRLRPSPDVVQAEMRVFLTMIERHYGKRPIIYTSVDFYHDNRLSEFKGYQWWLRSVADHPSQRYPGQEFLFWQYTGTGIVPGIRGDADINVFNGSERQWREWLAAHTL